MGKGILSRLIFVANEHPYYTQGSMCIGVSGMNGEIGLMFFITFGLYFPWDMSIYFKFSFLLIWSIANICTVDISYYKMIL